MSRSIFGLLAAAGLLSLGSGRSSPQTPRAAAIPAQTQDISPAPSTVDSITVSLLTMGPADNEVWELFGHDAIWIHDPSTHTDVVYNWGVFDSGVPYFYPHFLQGRMLYTMDSESFDAVMRMYRDNNRTVWMQRLNLTPAEKLALRTNIWRNALAWSRRGTGYRYDYFRDNCATRVRDMLDGAVGGAIRTQLSSRMTTATYRSEALRLMQGNPALATGVDIGLGRPTDHPLSEWEESFLPERFMASVRNVTLDGGTRPLVASETVLFQSTRPPEPTVPPHLWGLLLALGVLVAALVSWGARSEGSAAGRTIAAALVAIWACAIGLVGTVVTLLWTVTDHMAAHANENVLLFNPLWLVIMVALPLAMVRGRIGRVGRGVTLAIAALVVCAILLHLTTLSRQDNWALIALIAPPAFVIAWIAGRLAPRQP